MFFSILFSSARTVVILFVSCQSSLTSTSQFLYQRIRSAGLSDPELRYFGFGVLHGVWGKLVDDVSKTAVGPIFNDLEPEQKCAADGDAA